MKEYNFSNGIRGKHKYNLADGYTITIHHADGSTTSEKVAPQKGVVVLDQDVQDYFPDSEAVNRALRGLISLLPSTSTD